MRQTKLMVAALSMAALAACATAPKSSPERVALQSDAETTLDVMKERDPEVAEKVEEAHAHVVFPRVGKMGAIAGGAYGRGVVFQDDEPIGYADLSQASVGAQLGAQSYSELILFRDAQALHEFKQGQYKPGANASAVAVTAGGGRAVDFDRGGTAVVVMPEKGLMVDVSVNGQKFDYKPIPESELPESEADSEEER